MSVAIVAIQGSSGRCARAHAMPVRTPASGPANPDQVGRDRQAEALEPGRVAVGVEQQRRAWAPRA